MHLSALTSSGVIVISTNMIRVKAVSLGNVIVSEFSQVRMNWCSQKVLLASFIENFMCKVIAKCFSVFSTDRAIKGTFVYIKRIYH